MDYLHKSVYRKEENLFFLKNDPLEFVFFEKNLCHIESNKILK